MAKKIIKPATRFVDEETGEVLITPEESIEETTPAEAAAAIRKTERLFWKTPWNHDTRAESRKYALTCNDPTRTQQHLAHEADIRTILNKFMQTGQLPITGQPQYMDVEKEFDFQDTIVTGAQVQDAWNQLPNAVRNILKDPKTFTEYVEHCLERGDLEPLRELGLAKAMPPAPEPPKPPQAAPGGVQSPPSPPGGTPAPTAGPGAPGAP